VDAEKQMLKMVEATNSGDALSGMPASGTQTIIVISDSTGETAKLLLSRLLVQYEEMDPPLVRVYGYVNTPERLAEILLLASQSGSNVLVFATLVDPTMVGWLEKLSKDSGVKAVNVMSPLLGQLGNFLDSESRNVPGMGISAQRIQALVSREFFGTVEANEFVHATAFGLNRMEWQNADVLLVGCAKVGKTGVAVALAQRGLKAVAVNWIPGTPIPEELTEPGHPKVMVLEMSEEQLLFRRENHLIELQRKNMSDIIERDFADPARLRKERTELQAIMWQNSDWLGPVDCTFSDEVETASKVMRLLRNERKKLQESLDKEASSVFPLLLLGLVPALAAVAAVTSRARLETKRRGAANAATRVTLAGTSALTLAAPLLLPRAEGGDLQQSRGRRRAPLAVAVVSKGRLEMEARMRQVVNDEVVSEDPNSMPSSDKTIYIVSDSTGETAKLLISRLLVQFSDVKPSVRLRANVRTAEQLESIVDEVSSLGVQALVFATLADSELSKTFEAVAQSLGVRHIDVMRPLLSELSEFFQQKAVGITGGAVPVMETGASQQSMIDTQFFDRVKAVQFAQQHLSGLNSDDWAQADVILIGPSRVGKVSAASFLAQSGVQAATVDCGPDTRLPAELSETVDHKVLVLEMQPNVLLRRRKNRIEELRSKSAPMLFDPSYCDLAKIQVERDYLNSLVKANPQWMGPVDCTHRTLGDICSIILRRLRERDTD
jgi:regulator of PEP synthase PpsR (kinase-PPPase family)